MARRGVSGAIMSAFGAHDHVATLVSRESLAPHFVRLRFTSPTLLDVATIAAAARIRFWFTDPNEAHFE